MSWLLNFSNNSEYGSEFMKENPEYFQFKDTWNNEEILNLFQKSAIMQLEYNWKSQEAFQKGIILKQDAPIVKNKFGIPYKFNSAIDWLNWIHFFNNFAAAVTFARLFDESVLVFWDEQDPLEQYNIKDEGIDEIVDYYYPPNELNVYNDFTPFYPLTKSHGFEVIVKDKFNNPKMYRITIKKSEIDKPLVIHVPTERVLHLYNFNSSVGLYKSSKTLANYSMGNLYIYESIVKRAVQLAGGFLHIKGVSNRTKSEELNNKLANGKITNLKNIITDGDVEIDYKTPDMKIGGEYSSLFDITSTLFARLTRVSKRVMDGDPQGAITGGKFDIFSTYSEIKNIQEYYRADLEHALFMLGIKDTSFDYMDITPILEENDSFNIKLENAEVSNQNEEENSNIDSQDTAINNSEWQNSE